MKEIVIKIPDNTYKTIKNNIYCGILDSVVYDAIKNGTELPKGHGRLIDADELKSLSYEVLVEDGNPNRVDGLSSYNGLSEEDIDLAPTLVGADKEEQKNDV